MTHFYDIIADGQPIFVTALANERNAGIAPRSMIARSADDVEQFLKKHDGPGKAIYFAVARLQDGVQTRKTETMGDTLWLWADVDFKHHPNLSAEEITERVVQMRNPPTLVVRSGHGLHPYWKLHEPEDLMTPEARQRVVEALRLACQHVGGDPQVCEVARLMRLPGSTNTKNGDNIPVEVLAHNEHEYDLAELTDWWLEARPVIPEPVTVNGSGGNGHDDETPFAAYADDHKAPIDIEVRLENMRYEGQGEASIHMTQLQCTAALLRHGIPLEDVVAQVLAATKRAVAGDTLCANWNWDDEEVTVVRMCTDLVNKDHTLAPCLPNTLYEKWLEAVEAGKEPRVVWQKGYGLHVRGFAQERQEEAGEPGNKKAPGEFSIRPFVAFNINDLPPRRWLYSRHYQRQTVSGTIAPGGSGKTSLDMVEAIAMATARNLLNEQPTERLKVWFHNGEDSIEELKRRLAAICLHYNIPLKELEGWFFLTSGTEFPLRVAEGYNKLELNTRLIKRLDENIGDLKIDVAMLDPLVTLHSVPESDNGKMHRVVGVFKDIADTRNCAFDLAHHTRKLAPGVEDYTVDDIRGASAVKDAVRSARMINQISREDAKGTGISEAERQSYLRIDKVKGNTVGPARTAIWRHFINVELPNGDDVGVITAWEHPGLVDQISADDCEALQTKVAAGNYRDNSRAEDWVGRLVGKQLGFDHTTSDGRGRIKTAIGELKRRGVFAEDRREDGDRHVRVFVTPGPWRRP